jgi:HSP20 family protein
MKLVKYDPFVDDFFTSLIPQSFFEEFRKGFEAHSKGFPRYEVVEEDECWAVEFLLAGYSPEEINVTRKGDKLVVEAAKSLKLKNRKNFSSQSFSIPFETKGLDMENIQASFINGLLRVELPKIKKEDPKQLVSKIDIKTE